MSGMLGRHHSEETKRLMREKAIKNNNVLNIHTPKSWAKAKISNTGKKRSIEFCKMISELHKGKKLSEEHKHNLCVNHKGMLGKIHSIETKRKMSEAQKGSKNYGWKGGISSLEECIRVLPEYKQWRRSIFNRDNYICKVCNLGSGKHLHCHHIKSFAVILSGFLQQYSQFSPIEDKETLLRLAMTYQPFWDIDNGETICEDCHKLTKSYKQRLEISHAKQRADN